MNSIAIWWVKNDSSDNEPIISLDANIWLTKEEKYNYLEFGLKIKNYTAIKDIYFFLPFEVHNDNLKDKIKKLVDKTVLTNALFNGNMKIEHSGGKFHKVEYPVGDERTNFHYCELNEQDDISIESFSDNENHKGSKLKIKFDSIPNKPDIDTIYIRFRINKIGHIYKSINENNFIIDGLFRKIGFVEFNINSVRKLPSDIAEIISGKIEFKTMNLFLMTDHFTNFLFQSMPPIGSRILENHIWDDYLRLDTCTNNKINTEKVIAYHWKEKEEFKSYTFFAKISYFSKSSFLFIIMIVTILVLGAVGSIGGNYITTKIFHNFADKNITTDEASKNEKIIKQEIRKE